MKELKNKFPIFTLWVVMTIAMFMTSCESETTTNQETDEIQALIGKVTNDADVNAFMEASLEFDKIVKERIESNQVEYNEYVLENNQEKIAELLKFEELSTLFEKMNTQREKVLDKFPDIEAIDKEDLERFYLNNPQPIEDSNQSSALESRGCNSGSWWTDLKYSWCVNSCADSYLPWSWDSYSSCASDCYWRYCSWYCC